MERHWKKNNTLQTKDSIAIIEKSNIHFNSERAMCYEDLNEWQQHELT